MHSPTRSRSVLLLLAVVLGVAVYCLLGPLGSVARADTLEESLVGKWERGKDKDALGIEFDGKGGCKLYRQYRLPLPGKYQFPAAGTLKLQFEGQESREVLKVVVAGKQLTATPEDGDPVIWSRVETFADSINHPNGKPNKDQKKWLVGSWFALSKDDFGASKPSFFDFAADGTFLQLVPLPIGHTVAVGTYAVHLKADNFILLTFADTARTEALYAEIAEDSIGLLDSAKLDPDVIKLERRPWDRPGAQKVKEAPTPAFNFYRQCVADVPAAEKKLADKDVTVVGYVTGFQFKAGESAVLRLCTGDSARLVCSFNISNKDDELKARAVMKPLKTSWVIVKGRWAKPGKEKDPNTALVGRLTGLEPKNNEPVWMLHLDQCELIEASPLTIPKK